MIPTDADDNGNFLFTFKDYDFENHDWANDELIDYPRNPFSTEQDHSSRNFLIEFLFFDKVSLYMLAVVTLSEKSEFGKRYTAGDSKP